MRATTRRLLSGRFLQESKDNGDRSDKQKDKDEEERKRKENGDDETAEDETPEDEGPADDGIQEDEDEPRKKQSRLIAQRIVQVAARMRGEPAPTFEHVHQPAKTVPRRLKAGANPQAATVALAITNSARKARGEPVLKKLDPRVGGR